MILDSSCAFVKMLLYMHLLCNQYDTFNVRLIPYTVSMLQLSLSPSGNELTCDEYYYGNVYYVAI